MDPFWRLIERHRVAGWFLFVALTAVAYVGMVRLRFDDTYQHALESSHPRYQALRQLTQEFSTGDNDCLLLFEADDILSRQALQALRQSHTACEQIPGVESVMSLLSARRSARLGRIHPRLFGSDEISDEQLQRAQAEALASPLLCGRLLSADRNATLLAVRIRDRDQPVESLALLLDEIRHTVDRFTAGLPMRISMTGVPVIRVETIRRLQQDNVLTTSLGFALAAIVAWLLFRNLAAVALSVLPSLVGVIWVMGLIGWSGKPLDTVNLVLPPLLMVIGVCDSVHLVTYFRHCRRDGEPARAAAWHALRELAPACFITSLTTAIAFGSVMAAEERMLRDFGMFSAIGALLAFLAVMLTFPLLAGGLLGRAAGVAPPSRIAWTASRGWRAVCNGAAFYALAVRYPRRVALLGILAAAAMTWITTSLKPDYSLLENLPGDSQAVAGLHRCQAKLGGLPLLNVIVRWPADQSLTSREVYDVLSEVHTALEQEAVVSGPVSLYNLLASMAGEDTFSRRWLQELRLIPRDSLRLIARQDIRSTVVTAYVAELGAQKLRQPLDQLERRLNEIQTRHPGYELTLTGLAVVATHRTTSMIHQLLAALGWDALVIVLIIAVGHRAPMLALASILPNAFPLLVTSTLMVWSGSSFQYASVLAFSCCLGMAIDDTIHVLSRYQKEIARGGNHIAAVERTYAEVGPVIVAAAVLMLTGFCTSLTSSVPTIRTFGSLACLIVISGLFAELLLMPALLTSLGHLKVPVRLPYPTASTTCQRAKREILP
jgi:predicted RND superfamily exporter protein